MVLCTLADTHKHDVVIARVHLSINGERGLSNCSLADLGGGLKTSLHLDGCFSLRHVMRGWPVMLWW